MKNWYCGALMQPRGDWRELTPAPRPPANYKKPETIDAWIEERWAQLAVEAATRPLLGKIVDFAVLGDAGDLIVRGPGEMAYPKMVELIGDPGITRPGHGIRLWGVQIRARIHQLAVNSFESGFRGPTWGLFADTHTSRPPVLDDLPMLDPVKMLLGGSTDDQVAVARKLIESEGVWTSAEQMARFVRELTVRFGLGGELV